MKTISIKASKRDALGASAAAKLRAESQVPCVVYGGKENIHFSTSTKDLKGLIYTADFKIAEIDIDGTKVKAILKDAQFHPVTDEALHVDFVELVAGQTLKADVPVVFTGTSPGVKLGGKLVQRVRKVTIKTTPETLVDSLSASIETLELGDAARVKDLVVPEGVELMGDPMIPVCTVEVPRALKSAESEEEATEAAAAPAEAAEA